MSWIELVAQRRPQQVPQGVKPPENAADWYRISNSAEEVDTTDIYVYDSIGGWFGMYADEFIRDLKEVSTKNINLRVNSPGGSVFEGIAIANALRSHPANVTVYVDALAASIASVIALAGNRLVMMPQSQLMIHDASGSCYGNAADMEYMVGLLDKQSDNIADAYAARAGGTAAEWRDLMKAETWYSAKEAVEAGLADEVMPLPKREDEEKPEQALAPVAARLAASWDLSMYRYAGRDQAPDPGLAAVVNTAATQQATRSAPPVPKETTITVRLDADGFGEQLAAMVRQAIRDELAVVEAAVSPAHSTAVKDGTWDASANEAHLPSPVPVATAKKVYTYYDEDKVVDGAVPKSACKLPHHFVSADGTPGAASVAGVRNALARLPQTQGLSDAERSAAEAHLRKHLNAFNDEAEDEDVSDATESEEVEDADKKKLPPFLQPKKDDEDEEEESEETEDSADEEEPEASRMEPDPDDASGDEDEEADDPKTPEPNAWAQAVAQLTESPSQRADDMFNRLKEALL